MPRLDNRRIETLLLVGLPLMMAIAAPNLARQTGRVCLECLVQLCASSSASAAEVGDGTSDGTAAAQADPTPTDRQSLEDRFQRLQDSLPDDEPEAFRSADEPIQTPDSIRSDANLPAFNFGSTATEPVATSDMRSIARPLSGANLPTPSFRDDAVPWPVANQAVYSESAAAGVNVFWTLPREMSLGQEATCLLVVRNASDSPAMNVLVQVKLPAAVKLNSALPAPVGSGHLLGWKLGQLEPHQVETITLRLTPTSPGQLQPMASVTCTRAAQATVAVLEPQLRMEIEGPSQAMLGEPAQYTFRVTNPGSGAAVNVMVEAQLDENLRNSRGSRMQFGIGTLAPGESRTVQLPITGLAAGESMIRGIARADGGLAIDVEYATQIVRPDLQIAVEGPGIRYVDRKATYIATIHNPGPAPADNVRLLGNVPEGFRFVEATPGGTYDPSLRQVAWFVGHLEPDETARVGVKLVPTAPGDYRLATLVEADAGVSKQAATNTKVRGIAAVSLEVTDVDDPVELAGETVYILRVANHGSEPARGVQIAARVPSQMEPLDATGATAGRIEGHQIVFGPISILEPGKTLRYQIRVLCREPGQARFKAYLRTQDNSEPVVEEEVTRVYSD